MIGPEELGALVQEALAAAGHAGAAEVTFERPRSREHGDWATNVALRLAKPLGQPPRQIAQTILDNLPAHPEIERVEVAGPGFLNFVLSQHALGTIVRTVVEGGPEWGRSAAPDAGRVNVEFVSANPTGPLHVGHGRQAAVGDAIASLLDATGWDATREYYFNDAGRQMRLFGESVAAVARGQDPPEDGYHGTYIGDIAREIVDAGQLEDVVEASYQRMLDHITATLARFRVAFDVYFGERNLHTGGGVERVIARLRKTGHAYDHEGAVWLRTTDFGDDKDRVLVRADGEPTYFAADCAYMQDKFDRGFDHLVYVLGADHHGYVKRLKALAAATGHDPEAVEIVLHQFVNLFRAGEAVRMSKRTGEMVTFDELIDEVGPDAARYTFLRFTNDVTIDFDIAEVVRQERDNPVYYVQYSHARIAGIMRTAAERGVQTGDVSVAPLHLLGGHPTEVDLIRRIDTYPDVVRTAAADRAPHKVARYAEELAEAFHRFYTECTVLSDAEELTRARYWLCVGARQTLVNALGLLGVTAPERM